MIEYPKIEAVYKRSLEGKHEIIDGDYINDTIKALKDIKWIGTEKIDGQNTRIYWDGHRVSFGARTNDVGAQLPVGGLPFLMDHFLGDANEEVFEQLFGNQRVILFGELYGTGIQNKVGKLYRDDIDFILFDVYYEGQDLFVDRDAVEKYAKAFNCKAVPVIKVATLDELIDFVKQSPMSTIGTAPMEGLVARPLVELKTAHGDRVIVKIKVKDLVK